MESYFHFPDRQRKGAESPPSSSVALATQNDSTSSIHPRPKSLTLMKPPKGGWVDLTSRENVRASKVRKPLGMTHTIEYSLRPDTEVI